MRSASDLLGSARDDLFLQSGADVADEVAVSRNPHDEIPVALRILLRPAQGFGVNHIELHVVPAHAEAGLREARERLGSRLLREQARQHFQVQQRHARPPRLR